MFLTFSVNKRRPMKYFEEETMHWLPTQVQHKHSAYNYFIDRETGKPIVPFSNTEDKWTRTKNPKLSGEPTQLVPSLKLKDKVLQ